MLTTLIRRFGRAVAPTAITSGRLARGWHPPTTRATRGSTARGETGPRGPDPATGQHLDGWVQELSSEHVGGWACDRASPGRRLDCEAVLAPSGEVVARMRAADYGHGLSEAGVGDGAHAFWGRFLRRLSEPERAQVGVRIAGSDHVLPVSPHAVTRYEPLQHVSMDIVDNCNLRCPFCLYDYGATRTTHFMTQDTLDAALRFLPFTRDGQFWFSCLHEPTLHPELVAFVDRVPLEYRRKLFFTTNLAKRMPSAYFDWLAGNGMNNVNVSIESRDPAIYERMRKGARFRIFQANWDALVDALDRAATPTRIRYIAMAYKSNLRELPELVRHLLEERRAWQVEIRYTFDAPYIPRDFRQSEFLDEEDWAWLAHELSGHPKDRVLLIRPPGRAAPAGAQAAGGGNGPEGRAVLPGRYMFRLSWDGSVRVMGTLASSRHDRPIDREIDAINVRDVADPAGYLAGLLRTGGCEA